jgi:uncharacterized protein (DUF58 family)
MLFPYEKKDAINKLTFSVYISAALIYLLNKQRDATGLTFFSDKIELHTEARLSSVHTKRLYGELSKLLQKEDYKLKKETSIAPVLHNIAEQIHKRSLVIIFSDMISSGNDDEIFSALQHLKHNKHEVILFHVGDKMHELDLEFHNRPYKFVDLESGKTIKLNPNEVRELFSQKARQQFDNIRLKCAQYQIDFIDTDINGDFRDVLVSYLLKRAKLH